MDPDSLNTFSNISELEVKDNIGHELKFTPKDFLEAPRKQSGSPLVFGIILIPVVLSVSYFGYSLITSANTKSSEVHGKSKIHENLPEIDGDGKKTPTKSTYDDKMVESPETIRLVDDNTATFGFFLTLVTGFVLSFNLSKVLLEVSIFGNWLEKVWKCIIIGAFPYLIELTKKLIGSVIGYNEFYDYDVSILRSVPMIVLLVSNFIFKPKLHIFLTSICMIGSCLYAFFKAKLHRIDILTYISACFLYFTADYYSTFSVQKVDNFVSQNIT